MKLFYGNYPALQEKFTQFVAENRSGRLDKWLVVCASSLMRESLQKNLARQTGAVANIHFISAGGLLSRLDEEAGGTLLPLFPQDNLRDFLLKDLLEAPDLRHYPLTRGFLQAVKSALRDLADSCVPPETLEEYGRTLPDEALGQDKERFDWLVRLYKRYRERENRVKGFRSYQNAYERALGQVEQSAFLRGFSQIIIYGFYDLPGRQWDLLRSVRACYEGAVFAPYQKHPAYKFAERFFQTNWLIPCAQAVPEVPSALGTGAKYLFSSQAGQPDGQVKVVSALTKTEEVFFTAKEILRLHDEQGIAFGDIGVIVRTPAEYQAALLRTFKENYIPLDASFTYSLTAYALGSFCLRLFALAARGFAREEVLAVVCSPYFKPKKKQAWSALIRRSLVKRDLSQWSDLLPNMEGYDAALLECLQDIARRLESLALPQSWQSGVEKAQALLADYTDTDAFEGKDSEIYHAVTEALAHLARYGLVRAHSREAELPEEINAALNTLVFNETEQQANGVTFTDAIRARGLQFKVTFILGLNDESFPLVTPEDPLLRDYYRYIVRDVLGGWINGSLERADEEKLLFYAAATGAREKLYLVYARRKPDGKEAVGSLYLMDVSQACGLGLKWEKQGLGGKNIIALSGHFAEELQEVPIADWTPKELSCMFSLAPETAAEHYRQAQLLTAGEERCVHMARALARSDNMSGFDGLIGSGAAVFEQVNQKGFSPSSLQTLAQCPLKYFFDKALKLGREEDPFSRAEIPADRRGTAYHEILRDFYQVLKDRQLTHELFEQGAREILAQVFEKHLRPDSYRLFGIYPLVWEFILTDMKTRLADFVVQDVQNLEDFTPSYFERETTTAPTAEIPFRLYGVVDRIDIDEKNKCFRIADYKSSDKSRADVTEAFFKDLLFQPFLYVFMEKNNPLLSGYVADGAALLVIASYKKKTLTIAQYQAMAERVYAFLKQLANYIKNGTFFICPSDKCRFCPYGAMCRKNHFATLDRVNKCAEKQTLKEWRQ